MSTGKGLKSYGSITDSLNGGLRAPRRSGKSFDYLAGEKDEQRNVAPKKFDYHDAASPNVRGKSYDYLDADQNRRYPVEESNSAFSPTHPRSNQQLASAGASAAAREKCFGDDALNGSDNDEYLDAEAQQRERRIAAASGLSTDDDSEADDEAWLAEQLALHLPGIVNPTEEPLVQAKTANAGPIGLLGFGMTTILLNLVNTGHFELYSVVPAMGICYGGGAQFVAGLLEWVRGNTFGYVAFCSYGAFWVGLVCIWCLPNSLWNPANPSQPTSAYFLGVYLIIWGVFSFMMMCCTLRMNVAIFLVFLTVTLLFFLLGGGNMAGNEKAVKAAGYEGIVCGGTALYLGFAEVLNEVWDRTILPVVPMTQLLGWFSREGDEKKKAEAEEGAAADTV